MIIRGNGLSELMGILVGHLYFFLMFKYPQDFGGRSFLTTPQVSIVDLNVFLSEFKVWNSVVGTVISDVMQILENTTVLDRLHASTAMVLLPF